MGQTWNLTVLCTLITLLGMTAQTASAQDGTDAKKLAALIKAARESEDVQEWQRTPNYRGHSEVPDAFSFLEQHMPVGENPDPQDEFDFGSFEDDDSISPMLIARYGNLSMQEFRLMDQIIHKSHVVVGDPIPHTLTAHGVEEQKGGLVNLINIMVEGVIYSQWFGPLKDIDPSFSAGSHGPYFVILDSKNLHQIRNDKILANLHVAYLVPSEKNRAFIFDYIRLAESMEILSPIEADLVRKKTITYEEFVAMAKAFPKAMFDEDILKKVVASWPEILKDGQGPSAPCSTFE